MSHWITKTAVYHIYPLGFCGCERTHAEGSPEPVNRIGKVIEWIPHLKKLHMNAVYFGPVFESVAHGYDTTDYKTIDVRLGTNKDFSEVCDTLHKNGIRVILDGVFNHVGRDHFAFKDVQKNREKSRYCGWFCNLNFGGNSPYNDGFWYEGWNNCYDLVKLNLHNGEVVDYLLDAVKMWIDQWDIDGIRFDAADCLPADFIKRVHNFTRSIKPDFWLMGEIIHGNYKMWANHEMFDCVTNYMCYKGIYSSHNDGNYFEIADNIRYVSDQFGDIYMYNFVDNHDVSRLASQLKDPERIYCCYTLLYMMYGVPSVYYGSEFGIKGAKGRGELADAEIRPCLDLDSIPHINDKLLNHISALGAVREQLEPVRTGKFVRMELKNQTFSFKREKDGEEVYICLNISGGDYTFRFGTKYGRLADRLSGKRFEVKDGMASVTVPSNGSVILVDDSLKNVPEKTQEENNVPVPEEPKPAPVQQPQTVSAPAPEPVQENKQPVHVTDTPGVGVPEGRRIVIGGHYRHFKGSEYVVLNVAKDHETCEENAVYIQLSGEPTIWIRPLWNFLEDVNDHGNIKPRFEFLK